MDDIDLIESDPIFLTQNSYSEVNEENDILSSFDLKPIENDLKITRYQFRHGQLETATSLQNKIEESVPKNSNCLFSLEHFIAEAKQKDGGKYPSHSIYDLISSIQGYIRHRKSSSINNFTDPEFLRAGQVLDTIMKERATEGLGSNTRKQTGVISRDEDTDSPQQLLDTLRYWCGFHFVLREGNGHRRIRLNLNPQITDPFEDKDAKLRYLLYKEGVSKANAGGLKHS
ncbi:unnamed protein product [Mytilus coruscus]|uniref:QRICH1-like domain-containing protein n=1 Tax=Mytilus coruscus TaxID=42192 RepID=A0A6J8EVB2_MYTCO|nr:unnamed protein product [Mytilus coruscus]